jgi:hypothetical protein
MLHTDDRTRVHRAQSSFNRGRRVIPSMCKQFWTPIHIHSLVLSSSVHLVVWWTHCRKQSYRSVAAWVVRIASMCNVFMSYEYTIQPLTLWYCSADRIHASTTTFCAGYWLCFHQICTEMCPHKPENIFIPVLKVIKTNIRHTAEAWWFRLEESNEFPFLIYAVLYFRSYDNRALHFKVQAL